MNFQRWLHLSLLGNGVLLAAWLLSNGVQPPPPAPLPAPATAASPALPPAKPSGERLRSPAPNHAVPQFHWSEVAADDPRQLVANLRAVQCPPATIHLILAVAARERFLPDLLRVANEIYPVFYQVLADSKGSLSELAKTQQKELEKIDDQIRTFLEAAPAHSDNDFLRDLELTRQAAALTDLLAPEDARRVADLETYHSARHGEAQNLPPAERQTRLDGLAAERLEALRQFLTPGQLAELDLRRKSHHFKAERPFFEATTEEWEQILQLQQQAKATNAAQFAIDNAVARYLGPERGAEFTRQASPFYREFLELTHEAGLPVQSARQALAIREAAEKERQAFVEKPMPDSYRTQLQQVWRDQTIQQFRTLLGTDNVDAYLAEHGSWLRVQSN